MKIAVVGCGAMGSIYAALLGSAGHDVLAIDPWIAHIEAIAASGLRVEGASGDRTIRLRAVTMAPQETFDLVIVAVKAAHVAGLAGQLPLLIGPETSVLTIQNGLGSAETVAELVGRDRLAVGIAGGFGAIMRGPGHAFHNGMQIVRIGAYAGLPAETVELIADVWRAAGFKAESASDIVAMQWEKLICNVAFSAPCALTGQTVGEAMDDPEISAISRAAATEAWMVARANNIRITVTDPVAHAWDFGERVRGAKPSLLQDLENGRPSEIDVINGAVPREAAKASVQAPVNATLVGLVKQRERLTLSRSA